MLNQKQRTDWWLECGRLAQLAQFWTDGLSAADIGRRMGVSKNAVVGKAHRIGLAGRASPINFNPDRPRKVARVVPSLPKLKSLVKPHLVVPEQPALPIERLIQSRFQCSYPLWGNERPTHEYCADRAIVGRPYCSAHCAKAYVEPTHPQQVYA